MRGWGGGAVFLAMQVLEIPAGGRGFPLVIIIDEEMSQICFACDHVS